MMEEDKNAMFQMRFPQKLWYLMNLRTEAILWGGTGRTILLNYRLLHGYLQCNNSIFKTTNISSFVRQLNLYGFRKVTSHLQDPLCNSSNPYLHEYVHDYFQYGRPELLNRINRKALAVKKTYNSKNNTDSQLSTHVTPLQKARQAFRLALRKAAYSLYINNSTEPIKFSFETEDTEDEMYGDEDNDLEYLLAQKNNVENTGQVEPALTEPSVQKPIEEQTESLKIPDPYASNNFEGKDISCEASNFSGQFLSMPDLVNDARSESQHMQLLAEFDIKHESHSGITINPCEFGDISNDSNIAVNCVLPMFNNYGNDDISNIERNTSYAGDYTGEWDIMFGDIISKTSGYECGPELYS